MERAARESPTRKSDVRLLAREAHVECYRFEPSPPFGDRSFKFFPDRIGSCANLGSVLIGQLADVRQELPKLAILAEISGFYPVKLDRVIRFFDSGQRSLTECRQQV
jgi:hypothetical protein